LEERKPGKKEAVGLSRQTGIKLRKEGRNSKEIGSDFSSRRKRYLWKLRTLRAGARKEHDRRKSTLDKSRKIDISIFLCKKEEGRRVRGKKIVLRKRNMLLERKTVPIPSSTRKNLQRKEKRGKKKKKTRKKEKKKKKKGRL